MNLPQGRLGVASYAATAFRTTLLSEGSRRTALLDLLLLLHTLLGLLRSHALGWGTTLLYAAVLRCKLTLLIRIKLLLALLLVRHFDECTMAQRCRRSKGFYVGRRKTFALVVFVGVVSVMKFGGRKRSRSIFKI